MTVNIFKFLNSKTTFAGHCLKINLFYSFSLIICPLDPGSLNDADSKDPQSASEALVNSLPVPVS